MRTLLVQFLTSLGNEIQNLKKHFITMYFTILLLRTKLNSRFVEI